MIAVDRDGSIAMRFNCEGIYQGCLREGALPIVAIYADPDT
ncbi:isoaspartyl peptidase/L-asparaginase [Salipiger sp. HF18]|nr:isoaspartyl peptidase/L-asparaginase [Salipiger sp. HF18]NIY98141.1 isoaspartyl peptidase/L-asparaginase [Salipiger sp. HF18]